MATCDQAKQVLLSYLLRDAQAQEQGRFSEIGAGDLPDLTSCEQQDEHGWLRLQCAAEFRDRWVDARNHDWNYYPGVGQSDWPVLARQICDGIRAGGDVDSLMDNAVFHRPTPVPFWKRVKNALTSRKSTSGGG